MTVSRYIKIGGQTVSHACRERESTLGERKERERSRGDCLAPLEEEEGPKKDDGRRENADVEREGEQ